MNQIESLGKIAYTAYCEQTGNKSLVTGCELPEWSELKSSIRDAWIASAIAVLETLSIGVASET